MFDFSTVTEVLGSKSTLWWVWGLVVVAFITMSAILTYHWRPYYEIDKRVRTMRIVHHVGGVVLLIIAALILILS